MTGFGKFLVGAAATSLPAWGAHHFTGPGYIDGLETDAQSAFGELELGDSTAVALARDPLARTAIVSGEFDSAERDAIRAKLLAIPGMQAVKFPASNANGDSTGDATPPVETPSAEAVAECQSDLNATMEGQTITFASGSAEISVGSLGLIDSLAAQLSECEGMAVAVNGHTDATGDPALNQALSVERAQSVAAALSERGVDASRITAAGFGSTEPLIEGVSPEANAANRRIEFELSSAATTDNATPTE